MEAAEVDRARYVAAMENYNPPAQASGGNAAEGTVTAALSEARPRTAGGGSAKCAANAKESKRFANWDRFCAVCEEGGRKMLQCHGGCCKSFHGT
eukprot:SAG11_NODE_21386_length_426_cov_0.788991_1_plen_94_part_10